MWMIFAQVFSQVEVPGTLPFSPDLSLGAIASILFWYLHSDVVKVKADFKEYRDKSEERERETRLRHEAELKSERDKNELIVQKCHEMEIKMMKDNAGNHS